MRREISNSNNNYYLRDSSTSSRLSGTALGMTENVLSGRVRLALLAGPALKVHSPSSPQSLLHTVLTIRY